MTAKTIELTPTQFGLQLSNASQMWTESDLSQKTGTSKSKWQKHRWRGDGPVFIKLGRSVRYLETDVRVWLESRKRVNTSQSQAV